MSGDDPMGPEPYVVYHPDSLRISILSMLIDDPGLTTGDLSKKLGVSRKSVERQISNLKRENILARSGSTRRGQWVVRMGRE
jgi:predicted HTH transcriptional regulator